MTEQDGGPIKTEDKGKITDSYDYDWQHVRNFFIWENHIWGKTYYAAMDNKGKVSLKRVEGKESYKKFAGLWQLWDRTVRKQRETIHFEYPTWIIVKGYSDVITIEILAGSLLVLMLILCAVATELQVVNLSPALFLILAGLLVFILLGLLCRKYPKKFLMISIAEDTLNINFEDGSIGKFFLKGIKRYYFDVHGNSSFIVFEDGTKLLHLERVSYWPILRERLLSKLEPKHKEDN